MYGDGQSNGEGCSWGIGWGDGNGRCRGTRFGDGYGNGYASGSGLYSDGSSHEDCDTEGAGTCGSGCGDSEATGTTDCKGYADGGGP